MKKGRKEQNSIQIKQMNNFFSMIQSKGTFDKISLLQGEKLLIAFLLLVPEIIAYFIFFF